MSGITNATTTIQNLTTMLAAINPLLAAGLTLGQALVQVFRGRGANEPEAEEAARFFESALAKLDDISQRIIDKGEARLRELAASDEPFNPPREG